MYRKTYAKIDNNILKDNVKEIITKYPDYQYYFGVVKNNAYHHGIKVVNALKEGGVNYFAVSSLEEALDIRKYNVDTPILILEPISIESVYDCINNNITITIETTEYLKKLEQLELPYELKIHLKIDSGMNRLGFKNAKEIEDAVKNIQKNKKLYLEGIYTHFATSGIIDSHWDEQLQNFKNLTKKINLKEIPIIHLGRSLTLVNHPKLDFCNGIRLGIVMYGFSGSRKKDDSLRGKLREIKHNWIRKRNQISKTTTSNDLKLKTAFSLYSTVMSVRKVNSGEFVGYNATYKVKENAFVATIPIGYADGVDKTFPCVLINGKKYPIVADAMDMILVLVDNKIKEGMKVEIFGDNISVEEVTNHLHINAYHLFNQIQNRVPRVHVTGNEEEEIKY